MNGSRDPLLEIDDLQIAFSLPEGRLDAVRGVSFDVPKGGTVALVGESGSGKSVVSQAIMGILPRPAKVVGGSIRFHDPPVAPDRHAGPIGAGGGPVCGRRNTGAGIPV